MIEQFTFDKGLNTRKSPIYLDEGEMQSCVNFGYRNEGEMACRIPRDRVNSTPLTSIHTLHRYINFLIACDTSNIRFKWDLNGYCNLYVPPNGDFTLIGTSQNSKRYRWADYGGLSFGANGIDAKVFCNGKIYNWEVDPPATAPAGAIGAGGNPNGTYTLWYTYLIKFPNGRVVETAPSPASQPIAVTGAKISWSGIMPCPYSGSGLVIYRKLYRTSSSLISVYYVDTINDNTTTTYTDNFTDASLELNPVISTSTYNTVPANVNDVCAYIQRVFAISGNTLYISEPYLPFNFVLANAIAISPDGINLTSVVPWGDQLYISAPDTWYRLQGTNSSSWQVRPTFSEEGMIDRCTAIPTRYGVLGRWYDGIYAFDGMLSRNITLNKVAQSFFLNIPSTTACAASWDGIHYRFFDPSVSGKCLVLDFTYHPTIRVYYEDLVNAHEYHRDTGIHYYGKTDGYQYADGTSEAVIASFQTGDRLTKEARYKQKQATYLYYDINTNGQNVTVTFYADGVASANTITLNNSSRTKGRISIPGNVQGYRISIAVSCANSYGVEIYDPWAIDVTPFGD